MSRQFNLTKTSLKKINNFLDSVEDKIDDQQFFKQFESIVFLDVKRRLRRISYCRFLYRDMPESFG